eukprot:364818-Chlamydomonas_euryale.AAC.13
MVSGAPDSDTVHHSCELLAGIPLPPQLVVPGDRQPPGLIFVQHGLHSTVDINCILEGCKGENVASGLAA